MNASRLKVYHCRIVAEVLCLRPKHLTGDQHGYRYDQRGGTQHATPKWYVVARLRFHLAHNPVTLHQFKAKAT